MVCKYSQGIGTQGGLSDFKDACAISGHATGLETQTMFDREIYKVKLACEEDTPTEDRIQSTVFIDCVESRFHRL